MRDHSADLSGRRRSAQPRVRPTRRALLIGAAATAAGIAWPGSRSLRAAEANVGARDGENGDARAFLYDEDPAGPRVTRLAGNALWSATMESIGSDRSPDMVVGGEITIPGRGMTLRCVLRRNRDRWLPASHTIDLMFALPTDSRHGSVLSVVGILMKSEENARGVPLHALTVKVTSGYFVAALAIAEAERAANLQLLRERPWFDLAVVYDDGRRAILAIEKGAAGERAFGDAFAAWDRAAAGAADAR